MRLHVDDYYLTALQDWLYETKLILEYYDSNQSTLYVGIEYCQTSYQTDSAAVQIQLRYSIVDILHKLVTQS